MRELDGDAHLLEHADRLAPQLLRGFEWCEVEVAARVDRRRVLGALEQEELHLGMNVEGEPSLRCAFEVAAQDVTGISPERPAVGRVDVAEDTRHAAVDVVGARHDLERARIGPGEHVGLLDSRESFDRRAIEADALVERLLELLRGDGEGLEEAQNIGEPEPDETDPSLFDCPQHVVLLALHGDQGYARQVSTALHLG